MIVRQEEKHTNSQIGILFVWSTDNIGSLGDNILDSN